MYKLAQIYEEMLAQSAAGVVYVAKTQKKIAVETFFFIFFIYFSVA